MFHFETATNWWKEPLEFFTLLSVRARIECKKDTSTKLCKCGHLRHYIFGNLFSGPIFAKWSRVVKPSAISHTPDPRHWMVSWTLRRFPGVSAAGRSAGAAGRWRGGCRRHSARWPDVWRSRHPAGDQLAGNNDDQSSIINFWGRDGHHMMMTGILPVRSENRVMNQYSWSWT